MSMRQVSRPSVEDVALRAAQASVGKVIASILMAPFLALGFVLGTLWYGAAFIVLWLSKAFVYGFLKGRRADKVPVSRPPL